MTLVAIQLNPQPQFTLNCLVLGDDTSHIFPIKIAKSNTVGDLREVTKEKKSHTFQHVDTDTLVLWKVSIAINGNLAENFDPDIINDDPLLLVDLLSDIFSNAHAPRQLHIVVQALPAGELDIVSIGVRFQFSYFVTSAAGSSMFKSTNSHTHL